MTLSGSYRGSSQTVHFGPRSIEVIGTILEDLGVSKALVVTGKTVAASPVTSKLQAAAAPSETVVFTGSKPHGPMACFLEGLAVTRQLEPDAIISIGGSSPVDIAAGIAVMHATSTPLDEIVAGTPISNRRIPLVAVTTTLSQAEFSDAVGFTDSQSGVKKVLTHPVAMPTHVILDAELTLHTPERLWLATGVKALDTTLDTFFQYSSQIFRDPLTLAAARDILALLPETRVAPQSLRHRQALQISAWMSVFARCQAPCQESSEGARPWLGAVARHQLGAMFGVPHGEITAALLEHSLLFHSDGNRQRQQMLANAVGASDADALTGEIHGLLQALDLRTRLRDFGIPWDLLPSVVDACVDEAPEFGSRYDDVLGALEAAY